MTEETGWKEELKRNRVWLTVCVPILGVLLFLSFGFGWRDSLPTWGDEAFTLRLASESWGEFRGEIGNDVHPPLYFAVNKIVADAAGLRFVRILAQIIFLLLIWELLRQLRKQEDSPGRIFLPAVLIVSSAHLALFAPMMRYYALSALAVACATFYLTPKSHCKSRSKPLLPRHVLYGIFLWISLATSYITVVVIPAHAVYLLCHRKSDSRQYWKTLIWVFIASVPLVWLMLHQVQGFDGNSWPGFSALITGTIGRFAFVVYSFLAGEFVRPWDWWYSIPAFVSFCYLLYLAWGLRKSDSGNLYWLMLAISLPLGSLALAWIGIGIEFCASRLFFLAPIFLVLLGKGATGNKNNKTSMRLGWLAVAILVAVNLVSTYNFSMGKNFIQSTYIIPWQTISGEIEASATKSTLLLYDDDTLLYWLEEGAKQDATYNLNAIDVDSNPLQIEDFDQVIIVYSPRHATGDGVVRTILDDLERDFDLMNGAEYVREDETSMRWKSMLLRRPIDEVKKEIRIYRAAG